MLKYTATHAFNNMTYDATQSNFNIGSDVRFVLLLMIAAVFSMIVIHSLNTWEIEDKKLPLYTTDSCFSTCVNVHDNRLQQKLSPNIRNRTHEMV